MCTTSDFPSSRRILAFALPTIRSAAHAAIPGGFRSPDGSLKSEEKAYSPRGELIFKIQFNRIKSTRSTISTGKLKTSRLFYCLPINLIIYKGFIYLAVIEI